MGDNSFTARGLKQLLNFCKHCTNLEVVKVYKNRIGDDSADLWTTLFTCCRYIKELHLSHNRLTSDGIRSLVSAVETSRSSSWGCVWLRLEMNSFTESRPVLYEGL